MTVNKLVNGKTIGFSVAAIAVIGILFYAFGSPAGNSGTATSTPQTATSTTTVKPKPTTTVTKPNNSAEIQAKLAEVARLQALLNQIKASSTPSVTPAPTPAPKTQLEIRIEQRLKERGARPPRL